METGLKSYHMLTSFLWFMEGNHPSIWEDDTEEAFCNNLGELLKFVNQQLKRHKISHYFIRNMNLIKDLIKTDLQNVTDFIDKTICNPEFPR